MYIDLFWRHTSKTSRHQNYPNSIYFRRWIIWATLWDTCPLNDMYVGAFDPNLLWTVYGVILGNVIQTYLKKMFLYLLMRLCIMYLTLTLKLFKIFLMVIFCFDTNLPNFPSVWWRVTRGCPHSDFRLKFFFLVSTLYEPKSDKWDF